MSLTYAFRFQKQKNIKQIKYRTPINNHLIFSLFFVCSLSMSFVGCNKTKNRIDDDYRSGVVLIMNKYYYTLKFQNGVVFYFGDDGEGNVRDFESDKDSAALKCARLAWGTGFFISKDGKIATNKHVASRTILDDVVKKFMRQNLKSYSLQLEQEIDACEATKQQCEMNYNRTTDNIERTKIVELYDALEKIIKENKETIKLLNYIDPEEGVVEYVSELKVAFNGTFVSRMDDLYPCSLRDTSDKDVAIIQLNSKQTPDDKYIFPVPDQNMLEHYSFGEYLCRMLGSDKNDELYMIGFNYGLGMAVTNEGIGSQCTEGTISRNDRDELMYTIPAIPGSSGSPVLNRRGQLIAINYAGVRSTQGFNYGVKEKYLYDLMHKD